MNVELNIGWAYNRLYRYFSVQYQNGNKIKLIGVVKMKIKKIFSKQIAIQLMVGGFNLVFTEENRLKKWLTVFCFEETPELLEELTNINNKSK